MPSIKRKKGKFCSRKKRNSNSGQRNPNPTPSTTNNSKSKESNDLLDTSPVKSELWRILLGMRPPIEEAKIICNQLEADRLITPDQNWFKYPNQYENKEPSVSVREETRGFNFDYDGEDELEIDIEVVHDETGAAVDCSTCDGEFGIGIDHVEVVQEEKAPELGLLAEKEKAEAVNYDGKDKGELDVVDFKVVQVEKVPEKTVVVVQDKKAPEMEMEVQEETVIVVQDKKAPELGLLAEKVEALNYDGKDKDKGELVVDVDFKVVQDKKAPELGLAEKAEVAKYDGKDKDKGELELELDVDFKVVKNEKAQDKRVPESELGLAEKEKEKAEAVKYELCEDKGELDVEVEKAPEMEMEVQEETVIVVQDKKAPELGLLAEKVEALNYDGKDKDKGELDVDVDVDFKVVQDEKAPEMEMEVQEETVEVVVQDEKALKSEEKNMQLIAEKISFTASTTTSTSKDKDKDPPVTLEFPGSNMSFGQSQSVSDNVSCKNVPAAEDVIYDGPVRDSKENTLTVKINSSTSTNENNGEWREGRKTVKPSSPIPDLLQPSIQNTSSLLVDSKVTSPEKATTTTTTWGFEINKGIKKRKSRQKRPKPSLWRSVVENNTLIKLLKCVEPLLNRRPLMPYSDSDSDTDDPDANDSSKEGQKTVTAGQPLPNRESFLSDSDSGSETDDPEAYYSSKEEQKTFTVTSSPPAASEMTKLSPGQENLDLMDVSTSQDVEAEFDVDIVQTLKDLVSKTDGMQ